MATHGAGFRKHAVGMVLAVGAMIMFAPLAARAATFTVTVSTDNGGSQAGQGSGSSGDLRYCVAQANATHGNAGDTDTIIFSPALNGDTITLSSTLGVLQLNDTHTLTIQGLGAGQLTISGGGAVQVFNVWPAAVVTISGLTIANGNTTIGGGILNNGTLTLSNCTVSGNTASIAGGGILNSYVLTLSNCTVSGNTSDGGVGYGGGGIWNDFVLTVSNATVSGNSALNGGGGIDNNAGTMTISNSTIASNTAVTFGGGIQIVSGTVTLTNSIVAGNTTTGASGDDCDGCGTQSSFNLINTTSTSPAINPMLSTLGNYGGPTETMVPLLGSPALGAGEYMAGELTTDQRGTPRPSTTNATITLGAVQVQNLVVTTTTDTDDASPGCDSSGDTPCSLRDALTVANGQGAADIVFASGVIGLIDLSNPSTNTPLPAITGNLNLMGPGANLLTVSGGNSTSVGSIFTVNSGVNVTISGITIANGNSSTFGGGIYNNGGTLTVNNVTLSGNNGTDFGGGIASFGTLTVSNSTFSGNSGAQGGGIDDLLSGTLTVSNCTFSGNDAADGGGILNNTGTMTVSNSTFSGNTAGSTGGGIFKNNSGTLTVSNSIFSGNSAPAGSGGGIYVAAGMTVTYSILTNNTGGDCAGSGCPTNGSNGNQVGPNPQPLLAPLGWYGGPTQTMLPLPGGAAICAGSSSLIPVGIITDQRGFPNLNTTYTGYSSKSPCLDAGAVQTNYTSVQFTNGGSGYSGLVGVAVDTPAAPVVTVTENGQTSIGGVPVTLAISTSPSASGLAETTAASTGPGVASTGADFSDLVVNAVGDYTISATLNIVGTDSLTTNTTPALDIALTSPTIVSTASTAVTLGTTSPTLSDSAVLAGGDNPSGTITFTLTGPGGFSYSQTDTVSGNGTYTASTTLPSTGSVAGTYTWTVMYVGDPNNNAANDQGGVAEQTTVSAASPAIITTPNPTSVAPGIGSQVLKDTATLLGGFHATGTITFTLFSPGGAVPVDTETVTVNGNGTYSTPTGFTLPSSGAVAGTYQWDAAYTGDSNNNSVSENNNTNEQVVVNQASTLTQLHSSSNPGVYGHYVLFTAKVSSGGYALPAGAGTVTFTDTTTSTTLATAVPLNSSGHASVSLRTLTPGSHMISATYNPDSNHTTSFGTESFSVNQAPLTITASSSSMNYGGTPPAVTPFYSGFTYGDTAAVLTTPATCTTTATSSTPAGTDTGANTCSGAASGNYNISYVPGNVTVRKAVLGITASSTSMSYGGTPPAVTPLYSAFAGSDTAASLTTAPTCTTTATSSTPLGWDLGANTCSGAVDDNYNFIYRTGNMHIGKASLTITASSTSMSYGGTPPAVTPLYSAFAGSDTVASLTTPPTCKTTATSSTRAGTDTGANTCSGAVDSNYTITYVPGNVAIGMASLTITASSTSMTYGQTPPTVTPLYSGFVAGNVAGNLTTRPTCTTTATSSTPVGTLTAANTCAGAVDGNYNIAYVAGNMTVNQSNSTAAVTSSQNPSAFGQPVTFTATVSEAAPGTGTPTGSVTFLDTGSPLGTATLSGGVATLTTSALAVGSHTIGYSYSGDTNFNSRTGSMSGNPQVVTKASTLAQLHSSSNPGVYGHYVLFTATVSAGGYALPAGAGTVTFIDTATSQTLATAVPLNSSGHASVNIRTLSAGIAHIIQATYNPDSNHLTSSATESFSVNRAPLTIQASSTSMKFGGTPPAVTPIYFGFTYGDTAAVLTTLPTCTTTATSSTPVGTDTGANTCSGAVSDNFNFTYVPGNVTVTAR